MTQPCFLCGDHRANAGWLCDPCETNFWNGPRKVLRSDEVEPPTRLHYCNDPGCTECYESTVKADCSASRSQPSSLGKVASDN